MNTTLSLLENFFQHYNQDGWGNTESEIQVVEAKLSIEMPHILKSYYMKFGKCPYIKHEGNNIPVPLLLEDFFIPDEKFFAPYELDDKDYLIFSDTSSVSSIAFGIKLSELCLDNPSVYYCDWGKKDWTMQNPSLENFLVVTAFWQLVWEFRLPFFTQAIEIDVFSNNPEKAEDIFKMSTYIKELFFDNFEIEDLSYMRLSRIFVKDSVILGFEIAEKEDIDNDFMFSVIAISNEKDKILKILRNPILCWSNNNLDIQ